MKPRYKPVDRPEGEDIWFCHASRSPRDELLSKPSSVFNKPLSQVPDLNNDKECSKTSEEDKKYFRGAVHSYDSKYTRLAKAGGRKHLLTFVENPEKSRSPQPYPVPNWYYHCEGKADQSNVGSVITCPKRPEWMTHLDYIQLAESDNPKYNPNRGIIAWDQMSAWTREEFERKMQRKAKASYDNRKTKPEKQKKRPKPKTKANNVDNPSTQEKLKLPKITQSQFQGFRKLSGNEMKLQWYKKWYLMGK